MKTSELIGPALDYAVAKALGLRVSYHGRTHWLYDDMRGHDDFLIPAYSTDWAQGGPIIEREGIWLRNFTADNPSKARWEAINGWFPANIICAGPTPLIAAMRCFVASKLGDEIDIPKELQ